MRRTRASQLPPAAAVPPVSEDMDHQRLLTRVAWMYFMEGRRQEDIAQALHLNRMRVNRLLTMARESGVVRIEIDSASRPLVELEAQMRERYALKRAFIVPDAGGDERTLGNIGATLGMFLNDLLEDGMTVGTHRGRTCYSLFQGLRAASYPALSVVSLQGDLTPTGQVLPQEVVARLAVTLGASCHYLAAPTYARNAAERDILNGLGMVRSVLALARQCDVAVFSPGALVASQKRILKHLMTDQELDDILALGGVGSILGVIFDAAGREINHDINQRRIGLDLETLGHIPEVVMVGLGPEKVDVMRVALRRGGVTTVVTDEATARAILARE
jgi:lsr operon transcriptional repressor